MDLAVASSTSRLAQADYKAERERIRQAYGDSKQQAGARFEQELARLFYRSGWTQEQLAKEEGKSQQHISRWVLFGRFLSLPSGSSPTADATSAKYSPPATSA